MYRERKRASTCVNTSLSEKYARARNQVTAMLRKAKLDFFTGLKMPAKTVFGKQSIRSLSLYQT